MTLLFLIGKHHFNKSFAPLVANYQVKLRKEKAFFFIGPTYFHCTGESKKLPLNIHFEGKYLSKEKDVFENPLNQWTKMTLLFLIGKNHFNKSFAQLVANYRVKLYRRIKKTTHLFSLYRRFKNTTPQYWFSREITI